MIQNFNADLSKLSVYANGDELASTLGQDRNEKGERVYTYAPTKKELIAVLSDPVLVTDTYQHALVDNVATRYTLFKLFTSSKKWTEYQSSKGVTTSILFEQEAYPGVWGPSIDTLALCQGIDKIDISQVKKGVEIGAGSGFVSKHLLQTLPEMEELEMVELNEHAQACREANIDDERASYRIIDAHEVLDQADHTYDLIVCNPPYVPRPNAIDDNPYEGIGLLVRLIKEAPDLLTEKGVLVTNYSHLCQDIFEAAVADSAVEVEELVTMEVPLKITPILNNKGWLDYLLEEKGLIVKDREDHPYWHKIHIVQIRPTVQETTG